jgi:hypothetical protein
MTAEEQLRAHLRRYTRTFYDTTPEGVRILAVVDRRPQPPPKRGPARTCQEVRDGVGYGGPPLFMWFDPTTGRWEFYHGPHIALMKYRIDLGYVQAVEDEP